MRVDDRRSGLVGATRDALWAASGRADRHDRPLPRTGGPAGNARLTAWLGLVLLVLFLVECVTLLDLRGLVAVHIVVGTVLVPLVLLKTVTTGWRIVRYYTGHPAYREAGPPPLLLRVLGPLVVLTGLAVLGSGLALVPLGSSTFAPLVTVAGQRVDALTVHQASFAAWLVVVGLHTLGRTVPALRLAAGRVAGLVAGGRARVTAVVLALAVGLTSGVAVLDVSRDWTQGGVFHQQVDDGR